MLFIKDDLKQIISLIVQHKCQLKTLGYVRNYDSKFAPRNIINHTLYHKYATSQNYYFTKEINDILGKNRTPATIQFYDDMQFQELGERMKRYYYINEQCAKIKILTEFYKFHNDLPRFTVHKNIIKILNLYYDKKRRFEYYKIQRQIEYENRNNPNKTPKGILGDKPVETQTTPESESSNNSTINNNVENILQDIIQQGDQNQISQEEISKISKTQEDQKSEIIHMLKAFNSETIHNHNNVQKYQVFKQQNPSFKKSLKLEEFVLSQSSRTQSKCSNYIRAPLSTRLTTDSVIKVQLLIHAFYIILFNLYKYVNYFNQFQSCYFTLRNSIIFHSFIKSRKNDKILICTKNILRKNQRYKYTKGKPYLIIQQIFQIKQASE